MRIFYGELQLNKLWSLEVVILPSAQAKVAPNISYAVRTPSDVIKPLWNPNMEGRQATLCVTNPW